MKKYLLPLLLIFITIHLQSQQLIVPDDYATIQAAIDAAQTGDTVLVNEGEYFENISFNGKAITVGSKFINTGNTTFINNTIINGGVENFVVTFNSGEDTTSIITGFTIKNGGLDTSRPAKDIGGMVLVEDASPKISFNHFEKDNTNFSSFNFGAIHCFNSKAIIEACQFIDISHHSADYGAVIAAFGGAPIIKNNFINGGYIGFVDLSAVILLDSCDAKVIGNNIHNFNGGYVFQNGAGILAIKSNPELKFNTISNINFDNLSGAILGINSNLQITNNTLYYIDNGVTLIDGGSATVKNTIIWNWLGAPFFNKDNMATISVSYSDIEDGWPGIGNIDAFPKFSDPFNNYFHLNYNSACIEAGDPASPLKLNGRRMDIGAWLSNAIPSTVEHIEKGSKVLFYPNPVKESLQIKLDSEKAGISIIELFKIDGSLIFNTERLTQAGVNIITIPFSDFADGIYLVQIRTENTTTTEKIIKN